MVLPLRMRSVPCLTTYGVRVVARAEQHLSGLQRYGAGTVADGEDFVDGDVLDHARLGVFGCRGVGGAVQIFCGHDVK